MGIARFDDGPRLARTAASRGRSWGMRAGWASARAAWSAPGKGWLPSPRAACEAVILAVIMVISEYGEAHPTQPSAVVAFIGHRRPDLPLAALLLVAVAGLALAWRAHRPRLVLCCSTAAIVAFALPGYVTGAAIVLPAIALGTLSRLLPAPRAIAWAVGVTAVTMTACEVNNPFGPFGPFGGGWFLIPAIFSVALLAGIAMANRRAYLDSVRTQAAHEAQRRIDEERLRIARELHDVVAHTMATITVQAAAATQLLRARPDEAAQSLGAIRAASKNGLRELRAILNVLRSAGGDAADPADATQPASGLTRLDALIAGVRAAGLPVTVTVTGQPRDLPAVTDLAAFRIIQEALTNTLRHAGPATAEVTLAYGQGDLQVEVTDTGYGLTDSAAEAAYAAYIIGAGYPVVAPVTFRHDPPGAGTGHGLHGMRERAAAAGGTIEIGPLPGSGFRVAATLPLDAKLANSTKPDTPAAPAAERAAR